jgi:hypothetical protein
VVDSAAGPARQPNVVQDLEAMGAQVVQGRYDELVWVLTPLKVPCETSGVHPAPVLDEVT